MAEQNLTHKARHWEKGFLAALRETGNVRRACRAAGISRTTAYDVRAKDLEFARDWEDALEERADAIEEEARRRAIEGVEVPVFRGDRPVGMVRKYDNRLLMMMLRGAKPERYTETYPKAERKVLDRVANALDRALANLPEDVAGELRARFEREYERAPSFRRRTGTGPSVSGPSS